ncbi:MAG TPA: hypothetical protein DCW31_08470 [Lactobacillus sp.]|nr:hypothetical protein [Lactobacillus sp.]
MNDVISYLAQHIDNDELLGKMVRDLVTFEPAHSNSDVKQLTSSINNVARRFVQGSEEEPAEDLTHVHRDPKLAALESALSQAGQRKYVGGQPLLSAPRYTTEQS